MKLTSKITLLLLLLSITISCNRCKKEDPPQQIDTTELPPATTTGENTMGCLVNGEVWLPLKENFLGNLVYDVSFDLSEEGTLNIIGSRKYKNYYDDVFIFGGGVLLENIYEYAVLTYNYTLPLSCGVYNIDTTYENNQFEITRLDWDKHIISGFFEMRVIKDNCDTLTITEGRFDLSGN